MMSFCLFGQMAKNHANNKNYLTLFSNVSYGLRKGHLFWEKIP